MREFLGWMLVAIIAVFWAFGVLIEVLPVWEAFGDWTDPRTWLIWFCPQPLVFGRCTFGDVSPEFRHLWSN